MNTSSTSGNPDRAKIILTRAYDAPRALVYEMWTNPEHLAKWCHPRDFTVSESGGELRPGGAWYSTITGPDGTDYRMSGTYRELVENERLVFTHVWIDENGSAGVERIITVSLEDADEGRTKLTFHEAPFDDVEARDSNEEGWAEVLTCLGTYLATHRPGR